MLLLRKSYCYRTDLLQMLSKLFRMRKRFVSITDCSTHEKVTNAEQVVPHEKELLLHNRFVTNAEKFIFHEEELLLQNRSVTNAEQFISHEKEICYFCGRVIVTEQICYKC